MSGLLTAIVIIFAIIAIVPRIKKHNFWGALGYLFLAYVIIKLIPVILFLALLFLILFIFGVIRFS